MTRLEYCFTQNQNNYVYYPIEGKITNTTTGREMIVHSQPATKRQENNTCKIKFLSLHVAHECPLYCEYCYGDGGVYDTPECTRMSRDTMIQSVDYLFEHCSTDKVLHINFFGGEPLLAFGLIKECVQYSHAMAQKNGKEIEFSVSTSGLIMSDEIVDFLAKNRFSVSLSIDGTQSAHDRHRTFRDRTPSYDLAVKGFKKLIERDVKTLITATLTHYTYNDIDAYSDLLRIGADNFRFKNVTSKSTNIAFTSNDFQELAKKYEHLAEKYLSDILNGKIYDFGDFTKWIHRLAKQKRVSYNCTATEDYVNVDPTGVIYICHKFVGNPAGLLGNVYDLGSSIKPLGFDVEKGKCAHCWAHSICGGGCYYDGYEATGNPYHTSRTNKCYIHQAQICAAIYIFDKLEECGKLDEFLREITSTHNAYQLTV